MGRTLADLKRSAVNRFYFAPALSALQFTTIPNVQFLYVKMDQEIINDPGVKATAADGVTLTTEKPATTTERTRLVIQGKNFADPKSIDKLVETISTHPFFKERLRRTDPILLKDLPPRQVDPTDPNRTFQLFTIECIYSDRIFKDE